MNNYFEVTVKFEKTSEEGKIKKVTKRYLVDALTFTEAEARIIKEMKPFISGEFEVANINPQKYSELFWNESGDKWFKTKVKKIYDMVAVTGTYTNGKGEQKTSTQILESF